MKMMNHLLRRRFVNIVSENYKSATCSLHRLNVSEHLFYPSTATPEAEAAKPGAASPAISSMESLPEPTVKFEPEPQLLKTKQFFALANPRSSESRILWSSPEGATFLFDADSNCCHAMPSMADKGYMPVAISIAPPDAAIPEREDLYVMSSNTFCEASFQVLPFGHRIGKSPWQRFDRLKPWLWESLAPPPLPEGFVITSHTVLDDGITICVTAICMGAEEKPVLTCLFDTVKRQWWQSHWDLPFLGRAEYIPDLKLWLGLCRDKHELCVYDLSAAAAAAGEPPTLKHLGELVEMPKEWDSIEPSLLNLGDGRFCLARVMQEVRLDEDEEEDGDLGRRLTVLTGVEMVRGEGAFKMVAHKSLSYIFDEASIIQCVL